MIWGLTNSSPRYICCVLQPVCCFTSNEYSSVLRSQCHQRNNCCKRSFKIIILCQRKTPGEIVFVGAGPGEKKWLTWAAVKELRKAQVVLYDHLVDKEILKLCNKDCEQFEVGKAIHCSEDTRVLQKDIHNLLEHYYRRGKYIIRLKGGDPGIFGRLAEEIDHIKSFGGKYRLVPGISSVFAAPLLAGIPLTHKNWSKSLTITTGHDLSQLDFKLLAKSETLVFVMATRNLSEIAQRLIENGKSSDTPAAVIYNAGMFNQQEVFGTLKEWASRELKVQFQPGTVVVGKIV
ncbi:uroporphyrin-III C-methyltransferase, partial [Galdieria sulphuraria]